MKVRRYGKIRRTPVFRSAYTTLRTHLREKSLAPYFALPPTLTAILDIIEKHPRAWPLRRVVMDGVEDEIHVPVMDLARFAATPSSLPSGRKRLSIFWQCESIARTSRDSFSTFE